MICTLGSNFLLITILIKNKKPSLAVFLDLKKTAKTLFNGLCTLITEKI